MKKLYEIKHDYYCQPENFYSGKTITYYDCWEDFLFDWKDADEDYNLLFRFDWNQEEDDEDEGNNIIENKLYLHWILQRKGLYICSIVTVKKENEKDIKKWLEKKYKHLIKLWQPFGEERKNENER